MDQAEAGRALAAVPYDPPEGARPCFRLWHRPPEGCWRTWVLFLRDHGPGLLREVGWNRHDEIWTADASLDEERIDTLRRRAAHLALDVDALPPLPTHPEFGIEGFSRSSKGFLVGWTPPVDPALEAVAAWFSRTRDVFEERLYGGPEQT